MAAPDRVRGKGRVAEVKVDVVRVDRGLHSKVMTTADSTLSRLVPEAEASAAQDRAPVVLEAPARTLTRC